MSIRTLLQTHLSLQTQNDHWRQEVRQVAGRIVNLLAEYSDLRRVGEPVRLWSLATGSPVDGGLEAALAFEPEHKGAFGVEFVFARDQKPSASLVVPVRLIWDGETRYPEGAVKASHVLVDGERVLLKEESVVASIFAAVEWRLARSYGLDEPRNGIDAAFREEPYRDGPKTIVTIVQRGTGVKHTFASVPGVLGEIDRQLLRGVLRREGPSLIDMDTSAVVNHLIDAGVRL